MNELDEAVARLEHAVNRLEAASQRAGGTADEEMMALAAAIAARVDAALAKLDQLLGSEG